MKEINVKWKENIFKNGEIETKKILDEIDKKV